MSDPTIPPGGRPGVDTLAHKIKPDMRVVKQLRSTSRRGVTTTFTTYADGVKSVKISVEPLPPKSQISSIDDLIILNGMREPDDGPVRPDEIGVAGAPPGAGGAKKD